TGEIGLNAKQECIPVSFSSKCRTSPGRLVTPLQVYKPLFLGSWCDGSLSGRPCSSSVHRLHDLPLSGRLQQPLGRSRIVRCPTESSGMRCARAGVHAAPTTPGPSVPFVLGLVVPRHPACPARSRTRASAKCRTTEESRRRQRLRVRQHRPWDGHLVRLARTV